MANPGMPDPIPGRESPSESPPRPFPGERPLGPDEPSAPFEEEPVEPGIGPDHDPDRLPGPDHLPGPDYLPGAPADPGIRA